MRLRAMVWNVHGFRAGTKRIAAVVSDVEPDLLLLNETRYLGFHLRGFARRAGVEGASGTGLWRPLPNAVLTRRPWRVVDAGKVVFGRSRKTFRRGVVLTIIGRGGTRVTVGALHLGLSGEERAEHARELTDLLAGREPILLGGDLNEGPDEPAASWIAARYWDVARERGPTFPAWEPRDRIDYLFVSEGVAVQRAWVGGEPFVRLSDHLPVLADLELEG
ncbi:MAG: endonuclease/exonuclease/phosphatase family protein [Actinomycetota bacterium]